MVSFFHDTPYRLSVVVMVILNLQHGKSYFIFLVDSGFCSVMNVDVVLGVFFKVVHETRG